MEITELENCWTTVPRSENSIIEIREKKLINFEMNTANMI